MNFMNRQDAKEYVMFTGEHIFRDVALLRFVSGVNPGNAISLILASLASWRFNLLSLGTDT